MGLLQSLGLRPLKLTTTAGTGAHADDAGDAAPGPGPGTSPAPAGKGATPVDKLDADLGAAIDAITALLDQVNDDAAATQPRADLQKLIDGRAKANAETDVKKRALALTALNAAAARQKAAADKLLKHTQLVDRRETARKDLQATLGQVTALVLVGISDDGLRDTINKELKKQQGDQAKAEKIADPAGGERTLLALKPAALALLARAEKAKQVSEFVSDTWSPLLAKAKAAIGAVGNPSAQKVMQTQLDAAEKELKPKVAASDLTTLNGKLLPALQRIEKVAGAITTGTTEIDAKLDAAGKLLTEMGADADPALVTRLDELKKQKASSWPAGANLDAIEKSLSEFSDAVKTLAEAAAARKKIFDDKKAFEKAYAAIKADVDDAQRIYSTAAGVLSYKAAIDFFTAKQKVDAAVALPDWPAASAGLPELKRAALVVKKAEADERAFRAAYNPLLPDLQKRRNAGIVPGLPPSVFGPFKVADDAVTTAMSSQDWVQALAKLADLKKALQAVQKAMDDGKKFYTAFAAVEPDWNNAVHAWQQGDKHKVGRDNPKLVAARGQLMLFKGQIDGKVAAQAWDDASALLPDLKAAAKALVAAQASYDGARVPFDAAKTAVTSSANAAAATAALGKASPATAKEVAAYKKALIAVDDAEHAADFGKAAAALPAWQKAIDDLATAQAAQDTAKASFDAAFAALADYAEAKQLAGGPVPALAAAAKDFNAADSTIEAARKAGDWVGANNAVPALKTASDQLMAGKKAFNKGVKPADQTAFADKLKALEPRTAKTSEAPVPAFVEALQKTARDRMSDIQRAEAAKDYAAAEASLVKLEADLTAMEAGKARHAAHLVKFNAAKSGEIAAALALALAPAALGADRTAALAASEAAIVALADKDQIAQADAAIAAWLVEARGWKESQKAFAELHNGKVPDVKTLEDLTKKPGGEKVLDEMILKLPPNTPAKVLNAALKARFGFEMKRFDHKNADTPDLTGLKPNDPEKQDPELVEVYKLLAKIPNKQIKGKLEELVDFDIKKGDAMGGVYYSNKKVYMHSGRVGDLASGTASLNKKGELMPEDEEVDESCKPDDSKPPVPVSSFTLLHEAAHAEDGATGFMAKKKSGAEFGGWKDESPASIAAIAAASLKFDKDYILAILGDKANKAPAKVPAAPKGVAPADWEARRQAAVDWCRAIRASNTPWWNAAVCKQVAIGGRVYQESYDDGRWVSYDYAARSKGISGYQFRAAPEWFAELYAAFFSDKLKPSNPAMKWLKDFKPPSP